MYISIDGDSIGKLIEKAILDNDDDLLNNLSISIEKDINKFGQYLTEQGYRLIMCAGDNLLAKGKNEIDINELINRMEGIKKYYSFSIGLGPTMQDSYLALKYAKAIGKGMIVKKGHKGLVIINEH